MLRTKPSATDNHSDNTCEQGDKGYPMKEQEEGNFHTGQNTTDDDSMIKVFTYGDEP